MPHKHPQGAATVVVKCKRCGDPFAARVADRARGWGKFCSKSCKAIRQTQQTGYRGPQGREQLSDWDNYARTVHPLDIEEGMIG